MKFETLKQKAKISFVTAFTRCTDLPGLGQGVGGMDKDPSYTALLPFVKMLGTERQELREFADNFQNPYRSDFMALRAKAGDSWQQLLLRVREKGKQQIDNWDVCRAGKLIELFPDSVPVSFRGKPLTCYMADNEDCDWVVEVNERSSREAERKMVHVHDVRGFNPMAVSIANQMGSVEPSDFRRVEQWLNANPTYLEFNVDTLVELYDAEVGGFIEQKPKTSEMSLKG